VTPEDVDLLLVELDAQGIRSRSEAVERVGDQSLSDQVFAWLNRSR
jgi:hypothetical protein